MATVAENTVVTEIGTTAGEVWKVLEHSGPLTLARVTREVGEPRDAVMQAIGWLAREGKLEFNGSKRSRTVALRSE